MLLEGIVSFNNEQFLRMTNISKRKYKFIFTTLILVLEELHLQVDKFQFNIELVQSVMNVSTKLVGNFVYFYGLLISPLIHETNVI